MRGRNESVFCSKFLAIWFLASIAALLICCCEADASQQFSLAQSSVAHKPAFITSRGLVARGGSSSDEDSEGEYEEEEEDDETSEIATEELSSDLAGSVVMDVSKRVVILLGKAAKAIGRAVKAGFQSDDVEENDDSEEELSVTTKLIKTMKRMWRAALNTSSDVESEGKIDPIATSDKVLKTKKPRPPPASTQAEKEISDIESYLSASYGVEVGNGERDTSILGGTIGDALRVARAQAKLLVVFIPGSKPARGKKETPDQVAIESLLSQEVSEVAEKRARKSGTTGSFVIWAAKSGSPEAQVAVKRLKAKQLGSKGEKRPTLIVAYPAQAFDSSGVPKLFPRMLAQHHCSPPPSSESMALWLNALRKRHGKQYATMQLELREVELLKERQQGYKSSVNNDKQREEEEKRAEAERLAEEKAEQERLEQLKVRRKELRESLPDEPGKEATNTMAIALRFMDGRSSQRRFAPDTPLSVVFNWVDAMFEMERETVILSTMNGQKTFAWDDIGDKTLSSAGLGKMTGLRVAQKNPKEEAKPVDS